MGNVQRRCTEHTKVHKTTEESKDAISACECVDEAALDADQAADVVGEATSSSVAKA